MIRWTSLLLTLAAAFPSVLVVGSTELWAGHPPYQDRFFTADSKPLQGAMSLGYALAGQMPFDSSPQGGCNGQGGNCPKPNGARLQLWVPDEAIVIINGQTTKPQSLGGVHKNSRIYNLEGLAAGAKAAEIIVELCDQHGHAQRMQYILLAEAGQRYEVRYPTGFTLIEFPVMAEPHGMPLVLPSVTHETPHSHQSIEARTPGATLFHAPSQEPITAVEVDPQLGPVPPPPASPSQLPMPAGASSTVEAPVR